MRRSRVDASPLDETRADGGRRPVNGSADVAKSEAPDRHEDQRVRQGALAIGAAVSSWMTPRQAAAYMGVGVDTIYEACADDLKHVKLGYRTIRLRREWIDRWAEKHASPVERDGDA